MRVTSQPNLARRTLELLAGHLFTRIEHAPTGTTWTDADYAAAAAAVLLELLFEHRLPPKTAEELIRVAVRQLGCRADVVIGYRPPTATAEQAGAYLLLASPGADDHLVTIAPSTHRPRRVWFPGDPEPEVDTRVLIAGQVWTRHWQLRWILWPGGNGCLGIEWERLNDQSEFPIVEVLPHEQVDRHARLHYQPGSP